MGTKYERQARIMRDKTLNEHDREESYRRKLRFLRAHGQELFRAHASN